MLQKNKLHLPPVLMAWLLVNSGITAVLFTWLSTQPADPLAVSWSMALMLGAVWGAVQWLVLRQAAIRPSLLWTAANALSWAAGVPFLLRATAVLSTSAAAVAQLPRQFEAMYNLPFPLGVGFFILLTTLAFFGIFAGVPLAGGQWLLLWLHPHTRPTAQPWFGQSAWGWTIGLFAGGGLVSVLVAIGTAVTPVTAVPKWFVFALTGLLTGAVYTIFTARLLTGQPEDTSGLFEIEQQGIDDDREIGG